MADAVGTDGRTFADAFAADVELRRAARLEAATGRAGPEGT